jgi:hypothetical protein
VEIHEQGEGNVALGLGGVGDSDSGCDRNPGKGFADKAGLPNPGRTGDDERSSGASDGGLEAIPDQPQLYLPAGEGPGSAVRRER